MLYIVHVNVALYELHSSRVVAGIGCLKGAIAITRTRTLEQLQQLS